MKLISFKHGGKNTFGAVVGGKVIDLQPAFAGRATDLKSLIAADLLAEASAFAKTATPTLVFADVELLPVIPTPGKIVCVGLNYGEHVRETGREITESPALFLRLNESQVAHGQDIIRPRESHKLDYEGEIAVIIGKGGRRISEADSWSHIAGYSCYNDGSIRDWQVATSQWTPGKNFYRTGGFGPWMVTRGEIADGEVLTLETRLNGKVMQHATTDMLLFDIPSQIAYISSFTTLRPGDVIVTGTPGGVGARHEPPIWMKPGDRIEVEVSKVGTLANVVAQE